MATYGSLNNANTENTTGNARIQAGTMPENGTLTDLAVYMAGWVGGSKFRFAVYQGGTSDSDPTGATLVWESVERTDTNGSAGWRVMTSTYSESPSGSLTAGRFWVAVKNNDGTGYMTNADAGDWVPDSYQPSLANTPSVAYAATWPSDTPTAAAESMKAYITYTASAAPGGTRRTLLGVG